MENHFFSQIVNRTDGQRAINLSDNESHIARSNAGTCLASGMRGVIGLCISLEYNGTTIFARVHTRCGVCLIKKTVQLVLQFFFIAKLFPIQLQKCLTLQIQTFRNYFYNFKMFISILISYLNLFNFSRVDKLGDPNFGGLSSIPSY